MNLPGSLWRSAESTIVRHAERVMSGILELRQVCPARRLVAMRWNAALIFSRSVLNSSGA